MVNKLYILVSLAFLLALMGCTTPKYQFCCYAEDAFPEDASVDPVCTGMNETEEEQTISVISCDEEDWTCIIGIDPDSGDPIEVPVCPNIEVSPCTSNCSAIFCGNFFYDPRPPWGMVPQDEAHTVPAGKGEGNTEGATSEPIGLWKAQCAVQEMDALFLRRVENTDDLVMNTFRFGIGDSFEEFEEAQYYFPLTDQACELNPSGNVERYIVYAIPNTKETGGTLCEQNSGIYTCTVNGDIESYSYFDCASRCALEIYGYEPEIDPYNPYLSIYKEEKIGNPFVYGPNIYTLDDDFNGRYPDQDNGVIFSRYFRDDVGPFGANGEDKYPTGSVLYGASFVEPAVGLDGSGEMYSLFEYLAHQGKRNDDSDSRNIPYLESVNGENMLQFNWNWEGQEDGRTVFTTMERNPHEIFPWLLAHHSVYNKQFEEGHRIAGDKVEPGAEFECTSGAECLSAYCNNFDYQRGACVGLDGEDILCDCHIENGQTLCIGSAGVNVPSWDDPSVDVEVPVTLSAPIDIYGDAKGGGTQTLASLPSVGMVKVLPICMAGTEVATFDWEGDIGPEQVAEAPFFILQLGGGQLIDGIKIPDYSLIGWGTAEELVKARWTLDPCSAIPEANYWGMTVDDLRTVYCCDGTTNCETPCTADDDDDDDCEVDTEVYGYPTPNQHATRFVENCMEGYKKYIHVCYNDDAKTEIGIWGWNMGGGPIGQFLDGATLFSHRDGEWHTYNFCEGFAGKILKADNGCMREEDAEAARCYVWETSGGHIDLGGGDTCTAESESYLVIEPRRVMVDDQVRWAFGNCLVNRAGDGLEINQYGICESCGYLTMAKQTIGAFEEEPNTLAFDPDDTEDMQENTYCPDMVIHTPQTEWSLKEREGMGTFGNYILEPYGMSGYNTYEFGGFRWQEGSLSGSFESRSCTYPNGYKLNPIGSYKALPYTTPNAFYINRKLESMMKRNIQPVLFATEKDLWKEYIGDAATYNQVLQLHSVDGDYVSANNQLMKDLFDYRVYLFSDAGSEDLGGDNGDNINLLYYAPGSFLANTIINEGAAILVIEDYGHVCDNGCSSQMGYNPENIITTRGKATRFLCPNCMIAVAVGYGGGGWKPIDEGFNMDNRLKEIHSLLLETYVSDEPTAMDPYVDVIAVKMTLGDGDDYCSIADEEERFPQILANMTYLGRETLKRHGRNIVISDFIIDRSGSCWSEESAGRFMAYLGTHSEDLVKAGYIGLIYGDWSSHPTDSTGIRFDSYEGIPGYRGEFFNGTFISARNFAGHKFRVFYTEVFVTPKCDCVPCTTADSQSICNGKFQGMGPECTGYTLGSNVKWPDNCVREDTCHYVPSAVDKVACNVLYNNGTSDYLEIQIEDVINAPSAYRDVIASLNEDYPLCISNANTGTELTYVKMEQNGYQGTPLLFAEDGNQDEICDPTQGLFDSFCGYYPPIRDYRMECHYMSYLSIEP